MKKYKHLITSILCAGFAITASATSSTYSTIPTADTFVTNGALNNATASGNYGGAGALMVAGSASGNGTFESLLQFNLSAAVTQFNTQLGAGNWTLGTVTLTLAGNNGVQGQQPNNAIFPKINAGSFTIGYLANNNWLEGTGNPSTPTTDGVTFNSLSLLTSSSDQSLGTYSFTPPGNNVQLTWTLAEPSGFVSDIESGGTASLLVAPADSTVSYLFNSRSYGTAANRPLLSITAQSVPEPGAIALLTGGLVLVTGCRRLRRL